MSNLLFDPPLEALLEGLHARSESQTGALADYFAKRAAEGSIDWNKFDDDANRFLTDKLVALDRDKARFCYQLCRALGAKRVVEAGTSFGVAHAPSALIAPLRMKLFGSAVSLASFAATSA